MIPTVLSWSGGKDCCMALHDLRRGGTHDVRRLLTTIGAEDDRVALHDVPRALLVEQAAALGLPIDFVAIPAVAPNAVYEASMQPALARYRADGIASVAFGDLFLTDIRAYRERLVADSGLAPVFPLWGRPTSGLVADFIAKGFGAIVVSVDLAVLDASFAGRALDAGFVAALPATVDPCGENGEFHTFVTEGPGFARPVRVATGETVARGGYGYCGIG